MRFVSKPSSVLVSRYDRIGDLVLSFPAMAHLQRLGFEKIYLHHAPYTSALAKLAIHNGIVRGAGSASADFSELQGQNAWGLSLFHCQETAACFKSLQLPFTLGPRSKLSALWSYKKTLVQHRSRVEKSEMAYNVDLANALGAHAGLAKREFCGLPALKVPPEWLTQVSNHYTHYDLLVIVNNRGSAENWSLQDYVSFAKELAKTEHFSKVAFLLSGPDEVQSAETLQALSKKDDFPFDVLGSFKNLETLIALISQAKKLVASSTGPLHVAHALGVPVVGVYPPDRPEFRVRSFERWRPDGYWHQGSVELINMT